MDELRGAGAVSAIGLGVNEYEVCEEFSKSQKTPQIRTNT